MTKHGFTFLKLAALIALLATGLVPGTQTSANSAEPSTRPNGPPDNVCIEQATAQINQVRYLGKNSNGDDNVSVEWQVFSISECVKFGSGLIINNNETPLFGFELRVTITRRLGHVDSGSVIKREVVSGTTTTIVTIPRGTLE